MNKALFSIWLSYVLTFRQMFPTMFRRGEIGNFIQGYDAVQPEGESQRRRVKQQDLMECK